MRKIAKQFANSGKRQLLKSATALVAAAAAVPLVFGFTPAVAEYPERPIQIIVPFAAGGPTDVMARLIAPAMSESLGQQVVIENRAGAGGNVGMGAAARAEPDGYTLLLTSSAYVVNPSLYRDVPYDPLEDFEPIAMLGSSPNVLVVRPELGVTTLDELIERARAEPGALNYAGPGAGTTPHLSGELFKLREDLDIVHVPFGGAGPAIQAILAGTTELAWTALPPAHPHIQEDTLVALAITGQERWFDLPDVPTMVELGYEDFIAETMQALLAPADTPQEVIDKVAEAAIEAVLRPEIRERAQQAGFGVIGEGSERLRAEIEQQVPMWAEVIESAGIVVD